MNIRIQLTEGNASDMLENGLKRTIRMSEILEAKFNEAVTEYENNKCKL